MNSSIPKAKLAFIGGSSTFSIDFTELWKEKDISILEKDILIDTPFGQSPPLLLFKFQNVDGQEVTALTCRMHGWRRGVSRADSSSQLFWIFHQAGVTRVISEGGVGKISNHLNLRDLIIPDDYIDFTERRSLSVVGGYLLQMREPICPELAKNLFETAKNQQNSHKSGTYVVTEGIRFETKAEIAMMKTWKADIVGQSLSPEVYLSREIGACFAGIYLVTNYAEGLSDDKMHKDLQDIFVGQANMMAEVITLAILKVSLKDNCNCLSYRHPTMLRTENQND